MPLTPPFRTKPSCAERIAGGELRFLAGHGGARCHVETHGPLLTFSKRSWRCDLRLWALARPNGTIKGGMSVSAGRRNRNGSLKSSRCRIR
jgi:hypothetical protein